MPASPYDLLVIGAGLGGLAAAVTAARAGLRVLVLEHHAVPGGYAHNFQRGPYRFDVSLHALDGVSPGGWAYAPLEALGVLERVPFVRLDPLYHVRSPGLELVAHADPARFEAALVDRFPDEAAGIHALLEAVRAIFHDVRRLREDRAPSSPDHTPSSPDRSTLTSPDRSALTSPDRSALTSPDRSALTSPDRSALSSPDRSALSSPDRSAPPPSSDPLARPSPTDPAAPSPAHRAAASLPTGDAAAPSAPHASPSSPLDPLVRAPHARRALGETWAAFLDRYLRSPRLKAALSALWGYYGLPPSRLSAATYALPWVSFHDFGAFYPIGGSGAVSRALEHALLEAGGELRYGQTVRRIPLERGRAVGAVTHTGLEVRARAVISNANAPDTMLELVGRRHLPPRELDRLEALPPSLSSLCLYLGLDHDPFAGGAVPREVFVAEDDDLEAQYAAARAGDFDRVPFTWTGYSGIDPGCAPPGRGVATIMCLAPWEYADTWGTGGDLADYRANPRYQRLKRDTSERLLARAERHLPGLRGSIRCRVVATPLTNVRYTLNRSGAIYGFEQSIEGMGSGRPRASSPVPNLFLAGAWTHPGGGHSAALLSGRDAAFRALAYLSSHREG
jgi:prolycopene isomerase